VRPPTRRLTLLLAAAVLLGVVGPALGSYPGSGYLGSLLSQTPGDETVAEARCSSHEHPVSFEERLRGPSEPRLSPAKAWINAMDPVPVVGFLDRSVAQCGDKVGVHLSGNGTVTVSAYRVGWYGGAGNRLVWRSSPIRTTQQAPVSLDRTTLMNETSWPTTYTLTVQQDWTPGMYLLVVSPVGAKLTAGAGNIMPLVVQSRSGARLLAVASTLTWESYNDYGGHSTYHGPDLKEASRSLIASMDRPLTGSGLRHALVYDVPLARFFGRAGVEVEWTTDDQLDTEPSLIADHTAVAFPGHSEYWTTRMYDAVEAGRNHGVNIAFLGADPVYWQTRLLPSPLGPRRRMVIYRHEELDADAADDPTQATVRWRETPVDRDEAELVGTTYAVSGVNSSFQVTDAPEWMLAGTGLTQGSALLNAASNEVDTLSTVSTAAAPNLQVVMRGGYSTPAGKIGDFMAVYYTVPGGGAVWAAGTTAWPCGLESSCPFGPVPAATAQAMRRITLNVLQGFTSDGFALAHQSQRTDVVPLTVFWKQLPDALRGTGGVHKPGGLDED
jgi:hypothetical protein